MPPYPKKRPEARAPKLQHDTIEMLFDPDPDLCELEKQRLELIKDDLNVKFNNGLLRLLMRTLNLTLGYEDNVFFPMLRGRASLETRKEVQAPIPPELLDNFKLALEFMVEAAQKVGRRHPIKKK